MLNSTEVLTKKPWVRVPEFPRIFLSMLVIFIDGTTSLNSGQRLAIVNQTHLELVGGKLVLQKLEVFGLIKNNFMGIIGIGVTLTQ